MTVQITDTILRDMFELSSFIVPDDEMVLVALRGCQPLETGGTAFAQSHALQTQPIDYLHMRCTVVQWQTGQKELAAFLGSSVPHLSNVRRFRPASGEGVNRLATGYYGRVPGLPDHRYIKGHHGDDEHLAFRNVTKLPVWRTADDDDFEGDDKFEFHRVVYDNIHCARQVNEAADRFSSRGCVVVAGKPGLARAQSVSSELGPWRRFLLNAYGLAQSRFVLAVFEEGEVLRTAHLGADRRVPSVRFGSRGVLVARLQSALQARGLDVGANGPDGLFGGHTANALRLFQLEVFGTGGADLIAGGTSAEALGIEWPRDLTGLRSLTMPEPVTGRERLSATPLVSARAAPELAVEQLADDPQLDPNLRIALDTTHRPLPGWSIRARPTDNRGRASWEVVYDGQPSPTYLGYFFEYAGYNDGRTRGLARPAGAAGAVRFDPSEWKELGSWPELLYPTAWAESNANFAVINAWDRAAMTFGFIQLAAHTGEDFLPFFRRLFVDLPEDARKWFPELGLVGGKLCFIKNGSYRSLENSARAWDGGHSASYYKGDLMGFFNPDRYHAGTPADPEELHAAARWLIWTLTSREMRELQVKASIDNLKQSVNKIHRAILADAGLRTRYPSGVDGMRCDLLSVAIAAPHLGDGHLGVVKRALAQTDPIEAIRTSNYGPGGRSQNTYVGMTKRPALRNLVYDLAAERPA